jgi:pyruvate,water dikinase
MLEQVANSDAFELPPDADQSQPWLRDAMHFPAPLPVLAFEGARRWMRAGLGSDMARVNGYAYLPAPQTPGGPAGAPETWETRRARIQDIDAAIRSRDYASMAAPALVDVIPDVFDEAAGGFVETMLAAGETVAVSMPFVAFCETRLAPDGELLAMTMLQGIENASASSGEELGELAELANRHPAVEQALRRGDFASLRTDPRCTPFIERFDAYLDEYGRGTSTWFEFHKPAWLEDPLPPLRIVARYVASPRLAPAAARERAREQRAAALAEAESRLDPRTLEEFRALLAGAAAHVPVIEGRAYWQLRLAGAMRLPVMALGWRLAEAGAIDAPADVFHFSLAELHGHIEGSALPDLRPLARERAGELERWGQLSPPVSLGLPVPPAVLASVPVLRSLLGFRLRDGLPPAELLGSAASRGTARGVARVIRDIEDGDRLGPGEILVCPFTAPPWTPLFAIAAAVVTDAGGVLSHSAIAAREYGIPCVSGTGDATRRIPDGAIISVDGTNGTVRIEG